MRNFFSVLFRFLFLWVINAFSLFACSKILPGLIIEPNQQYPLFVSIMSVGLIFTILNLLIRPFILLIAIPLNGLTAGFFSLIVNGLILMLVPRWSDIFIITGWGQAILAGFIMAFVNILITSMIPIDEDFFYYDILGERIRNRTTPPDLSKKGIVVLEIDGLSFGRLQYAIEKRKMPYLKELVDSEKFITTEYDCGIPSQTSSCQAGIMFGDNQNICAFRWYDKKAKKVITSSNFSDTGKMEQRIITETNTGLLDGGLSINNMMSGNAAVSMLTVSSLMPKSNEERVQRNLDLYLFSLKPYLLTKSILFTLYDALTDIVQYLWARIRRKQPLINRLQGFYPLVRGATNILLRDISTAMTINEIYRGGPAMYTTFYGYDEIAHHSGPDSFEAFHALVGIDRAIKKIHHAMESDTRRGYELFVISDHGQSFGATFKQRYGVSLSDFISTRAAIRAQNPERTQVIGISSTADNSSSLRAAIAGLSGNVPDNPKAFSGVAFQKFENYLEEQDNLEHQSNENAEKQDIWALASGNLVNAYFSFENHKVSLAEIEEHYPGLVEDLVEHPGVGLVIARENDHAIAIGKKGLRDLHTGKITGEDPLKPYGSSEKREEQLKYLAEFPNGGDLILFSSVYSDGTVAAFEELIGSHGGMGGNQNSAFIFHESDVPVPADLSNAYQVYDVLKSRRELPAPALIAAQNPLQKEKKQWAWHALIGQIKDTKNWTPLLRDVLLFQTSAFRKIYANPALNGPGILIALISFLINLIVVTFFSNNQSGVLSAITSWLITWGIFTCASYLSFLVLRKKQEWDGVIRTMLFCTAFDYLWIGALIPRFALFWTGMIFIIRFLAVSIAIYGISQLEGRRRLLVLMITFVNLCLICVMIYVLTESIAYLSGNHSILEILKNIDKLTG